MTRINLVPPSELTDQHLFAEFREIKMVPRALARSLRTRTKHEVLSRIPPTYRLNAGHVLFFYDKGLYLEKRFESLCRELRRRGTDYNREAVVDMLGVFQDHDFRKDYKPTPEAFRIIRRRIRQKIDMQPSWYRYYGMPLNDSDFFY